MKDDARHNKVQTGGDGILSSLDHRSVEVDLRLLDPLISQLSSRGGGGGGGGRGGRLHGVGEGEGRGGNGRIREERGASLASLVTAGSAGMNPRYNGTRFVAAGFLTRMKSEEEGRTKGKGKEGGEGEGEGENTTITLTVGGGNEDGFRVEEMPSLAPSTPSSSQGDGEGFVWDVIAVTALSEAHAAAYATELKVITTVLCSSLV